MMTGEFFSSIVLNIVIVAIGFYVLYHVIRAGVRDGIKMARQSGPTEKGLEHGPESGA
ncbi:hypothetical protein [Arthrobacter sp. MYb227]|uniref:hypothetical protein n=1 Tax=Arthrobacter sp. MYb227 TaxID=1848601 RepID=UPI0015E418AD|nr:hypothetical protein [Arthrobacter sp. MYb227]